ncbi:MAG: MBL fold metallo-hydrolase [Candidatus Dormibacteria bacterium]
MAAPRESLDLDVVLAPNPSPMTGRGTNTYVLGRGNDVVVIDPGPDDAGHMANIENAVDGRGRAAMVLLTHHHPDHGESAAAVARRLGAPLAAIPHRLSPALDLRLVDNQLLEVGREVLTVLATPGHCRDHACFEWPAAAAIFAGDLVAGEGFIVIDPPEGDMDDYLRSLARVSERPAMTRGDAVLLPGHGPAIHNPRGHLDTYVAHRLSREQRVWDALADQPRPLAALLPMAYADTPEVMFPIAQRSLQAHLDRLVRLGRAALTDEGYLRRA